MSGKTDWATTALPSIFSQRYGTVEGKKLSILLKAGRCEWRFSGNTHLELRSVEDKGIVCCLTTGKTSSNPVYLSKLRTFIRKFE